MSPSVNGSCPGSAPSRNARAAPGSPYPRRTSTEAVVRLMPSSSASERTAFGGHSVIDQVAFSIGQSRVRRRPDGVLHFSLRVARIRSPLLRIAVASLAAAGIACAAAPAAEQLQTIAPGVRIFGAHVGGLTLEPARQRIETALERPIAIVYRGEVLTVTPRQLGASAR